MRGEPEQITELVRQLQDGYVPKGDAVRHTDTPLPETVGRRVAPPVVVLMSDDGDRAVQVEEHSDETRLEAAWAVMDECIGGSPGEAPYEAGVLSLVSAAEKVLWSQHRNEPTEDDGCMCEEAGWWCDQAKGPSRPFWFFEWSAIDAAEKAGDEATHIGSSAEPDV